MKCTPWIVGSLSLALIVGCKGNRGNESGAAAGTSSETGTMQNGAGTTDTAMTSTGTDTSTGSMRGMSSDTAHADAGMHSDMNRSGSSQAGATGAGRTGQAGSSDSAKGNQTKSGVTNTKTGKSTLGKGVTRTRPDQGQPVTSKGDTISAGADTSAGNQ
jgi:hypothetical protein